MIYSAIRGNQAELTQLLLDSGSLLNVQDVNNETPLEYATQTGSTEVIKVLLKHKKLYVKNNYLLLLKLSIKAKDFANMKLLISKGANYVNDFDKFGCNAFLYSCAIGDLETTQVLLDSEADQTVVDINRRNALTRLIYRCRSDKDPQENIQDDLLIEMMKVLIEKGIKVDMVDMYGWALLHYAVQYQNLPAIDLLLHYKCQLNLQTVSLFDDIAVGSTALHIAVNLDHEYLVRKLCTAGASCNLEMSLEDTESSQKGLVSPLHLAISKSNFNTAQILVEYGADINALYIDGSSVVHRSLLLREDQCIGNKNNFIQKLIEQGFKINMQDAEGNTILHGSVLTLDSQKYDDNLKFAQQLLTMDNFNKNTQNNNGETAFVTAMKFWHELSNKRSIRRQIHELVVTLMQTMVSTVDHSLADKSGNMILHYAFMCFNARYFHFVDNRNLRNMIIQLLEEGCDYSAKNLNGETPLHAYVVRKTNVYYYTDDRLAHCKVMQACVARDDINNYGITLLNEALSLQSCAIIDCILARDIHTISYINTRVPQLPQETELTFTSKNTGFTPLQIAIENFRTCSSAVEKLLKRGANIHVRFTDKPSLVDTVLTRCYCQTISPYLTGDTKTRTHWFHTIFQLLSAGACPQKVDPITEYMQNCMERLEGEAFRNPNCLPMLRRATRLGHKFYTRLNKLETTATDEVKTILNHTKHIFPLDVLASRIVRQNLYPNAWFSAKQLNLPSFVYSKHFEAYENTPMPEKNK